MECQKISSRIITFLFVALGIGISLYSLINWGIRSYFANIVLPLAFMLGIVTASELLAKAVSYREEPQKDD